MLRVLSPVSHTGLKYVRTAAGAKQTELIALLHRSGSLHSVTKKPFSVNPAGMVSMDESQPSTAGAHAAFCTHF